MRSSLRSAYPLRFWLFVLYAVGVPGFVKFDQTNRTHLDLFNPQSIASISLFVVAAGLFALLTLKPNGRILYRPIAYSPRWLMLLAAIFMGSSIVSPQDSLPISSYRMCEWMLAVLMLLSVYTREPAGRECEAAVDMISAICWITIAIPWLMIPVSPTLALNALNDFTGVIEFRLGGFLVHPNALGVVAGIAFWKTYLFGRKTRRIAGCGFALLTLLLTYSRGAWVGFAITVFAYFLLRRDARFRTMMLVTSLLGLPLIALFFDQVIKLLGRGKGVENLSTFSERTLVWVMAMEAIVRRPWIGYGYIDGPKQALLKVPRTLYWNPGHYHSEFLQAVGAGGIFAGVIMAWIYLDTTRMAFRAAQQSKEGIFLFAAMVQLLAFALVTVIFGKQFGQLGAGADLHDVGSGSSAADPSQSTGRTRT